MSRPYVLVIDDEVGVADALGDVLTDEGYEVAVATDGAEGLEKLRGRRPDVVLLDLMMPVLDGWGVLRALDADPERRSIPVVLMTAGDVERARAVPGRQVLIKPFRLHDLMACLAAVLGARG